LKDNSKAYNRVQKSPIRLCIRTLFAALALFVFFATLVFTLTNAFMTTERAKYIGRNYLRRNLLGL
jgi:hypothetical protein